MSTEELLCVGCGASAPSWVPILAIPYCCGNRTCVSRLDAIRYGPYLLDVEPVPFSRPRPRGGDRSSGWYTPGAETYRAAIAEQLMVAGAKRRNLSEPHHLDVTFTVSHRRKLDLDNLCKLFIDQLVALDVLHDDTVDNIPSINARTRFDAIGSIVFSLTPTGRILR